MRGLPRAVFIGVLLLASASVPLLAAEPTARLGTVSGTVAVVRADGSAIQPAGQDTAIGPGDRIGTVGKSAATLVLPGIGQVELGAETTLVVRTLHLDGSMPVVMLKVVQGTTVHRLSAGGGALDLQVLDPSGQAVAHARGDAVFGLARDENGNVTAGCDRCPSGVLTFPGDRSALSSGRSRTLTARGDVLEDDLGGSLYDALARGASADDQNSTTSSSERLPAGQRTGSRDRRPRQDNDDTIAVVAPAATFTPTPIPLLDATIANFVYLPDPIRIRAGQAVRWTNLDPDVHTVTADDLTFTSPRLNQGETFTRTFLQPGTYQYFCEPHPFMHGTVEVQ